MRKLSAAALAALIAAGTGLVASCSASPTPGAAYAPGTPGASATAHGTADSAATAHGAQSGGATGHGTAAPNTQVTGTLANGTTWVAEYPAPWNGTLVLYSHGYGDLTAADAPDADTRHALLGAGYTIAQLLGDPHTRLVGLDDESAFGTAQALNEAARQAQGSSAGKARLALAMAFLNIPAWDPDEGQPAPADNPEAQESAQFATLMDGSANVLAFIEGGRESIERAVGGQPASTSGTDFTRLFAGSPYRQEVTALYRTAGLNLNADLAALTAHAVIKADPAALQRLKATSDPTGKLAVPELDLHTIGDNLVPVQNEYNYGQLVNRAGSGSLLRQAYTNSYGHCNFSVSEQMAGLQALLQRVTTGHWDNVATTASLEQAAAATHLGTAKFTDYHPGELTGAVTGS